MDPGTDHIPPIPVDRFEGILHFLGAVVMLGKMRQEDQREVAPVPADEIACIVVAQVAPFGCDSLLEMAGVGSVHQHLFIVVRFQQHGVQVGNDLLHLGGHAARVREDSEPADDESAGYDVMGGLDGGDLQILDPEAGVKVAESDGSHPLPARCINIFPDVNGDVEPAGDRSDPLVMIPVGVGEDDPVQIPDLFAQGGHSFGRFPVAFPGVEQHGGPCRLHKITVAVASRCDDGEFH